MICVREPKRHLERHIILSRFSASNHTRPGHVGTILHQQPGGRIGVWVGASKDRHRVQRAEASVGWKAAKKGILLALW